MLAEIKHRVNIVLGNVAEIDKLEEDLREHNLSFVSYKISEEEKTLSMLDVASIINLVSVRYSDKLYILINKNIRNTVIQNSLLKTLEESDENCVFVIFSHTANHLLDTFISRSVIIDRLSNKNQYSDVKRKLIVNKNFKALEQVLYIEDKSSRGLLSDKQVKDFINVV